MIKPPDYISAIKPYIPGKPVEELERELDIKGSIKLASNENPLGPSQKATKALLESLSIPDPGSSLNRYPDGSGYYLTKALSEKLSVQEEEIILGNGSNELLDIVVRTFMQPGDEAVMAHPSFVVYSMSVQAQGGTSVRIPLKEYAHDLEAMADAVTPKTKMLFIANPNNPTGTINNKEEFDRMMKRIPENVLVVMDEAYFEYVADPDYADSMKHFREGRDLLILRTFSKIYGLAGLRIGYGITNRNVTVEMNKLRPPFNTNTMAQKAALSALGDEEHLENSKKINEQGKIFLYRELDALGMKYVPTEANFIYMPLEQSAQELNDKLLKKGVIIRPMGPREIRVTIGLPEENRRFVEVLKEVINQ